MIKFVLITAALGAAAMSAAHEPYTGALLLLGLGLIGLSSILRRKELVKTPPFPGPRTITRLAATRPVGFLSCDVPAILEVPETTTPTTFLF